MRVQNIGEIFSDISKLDTRAVQLYAARLEKRKGLLEIVFNTVQEGILVIDHAFHIKYHNAAAGELLCLPENLKNVRLSQYLPDLIPLAAERQDPERKEPTRLVSRSEADILYPVPRRVQFYMVPHEHGTGDATVIISDITQQKRAADTHIENETLRMVSLLAASVAHEIGNPLNSISLYLQLMKRQIERGEFKPEAFLEMLDTAANEVERLDGMIGRFLTALRPEKPHFTQVQLSLLIAECLKVMLPELELKGVKAVLDVPNYLPAIAGDSNRLKQMILNLLKNAIHATPAGGTITFRCNADDEHLIFTISDTGVGIAPEDIGRIFAPFQTTKQTGSGLGLMVVERVVREHGATIRVESEPGIGTTFTVKFPLEGRIRKSLPSSEPEET